MKTTASNRKIRMLISAITDGTLVPRPEFQRRLVWANKHKIEFLKTVLDGYPFPEIYIAAGEVDTTSGRGTELLVDGQQRITTLYQYFRASDDLQLGGKLLPYASLEEEKKKLFLEYDVVIRDLGSMELPQIRKIFQRINSTGYSLNAMEMQNARFDGALKRFAQLLATDDFFAENRIFSARELRRMHDVRFTLTILITMMSTYFNRDEELELYLEKYNEEFPQKKKYSDEFHQIMTFITEMKFPPKCRVWKLTDIFTLIVELHRVLCKEKKPLKSTNISALLLAFYISVEDSKSISTIGKKVSDYHKASIQATNDRSSRMRRGEIIRQVLLS